MLKGVEKNSVGRLLQHPSFRQTAKVDHKLFYKNEKV